MPSDIPETERSNAIEVVDAELLPPKEDVKRAEVLSGPPLEIGQWYWVKSTNYEGEEYTWFGCITHLGSNYAELTNLDKGSMRVHFDIFDETCSREHEPEKVIEQNTRKHQTEVKQLMERVVEVTARLGVGYSPELASGGETQALARVSGDNRDFGTYKTDLVKAKEDLLPELFKQIEDANKEMVRWMKASVIPFRAQVEQMRGVLDRIDSRLFSVELYAGLTETVAQIADGEPAPLGEKIRLLQRRCYMDEECLANYETGGMEFKDIHAFDAWIARRDNRDRLLPFPRCVVSFRVRRYHKEREIDMTSPLTAYISIFRAIEEGKADDFTFLYLRNGEKLYRLATKLEFGEKLFPDMDRQALTGKLWGRVWHGVGSVEAIITDEQYQGLIEEYEQEKLDYKREKAKHKKAVKAWEAAKAKAKKEKRDFNEHKPWSPSFHWNDPRKNYQQYEPNNLYYDDMMKKVQREMEHHNRIGLILQGLLDRSPVFHPHPPWKIWSTDGFRQALELVFDQDRALVAGEKPDFEAYRAKLNASLKVGSITVGQRPLWERVAREQERKGQYRFGDPGPAVVARLAAYQPRAKRCTWAWYRRAQTRTWEEPDKQLRTTFSCSAGAVLNVDAYKPGDFHQFFDDPRTREEYLKWAPLMLEAEEYHAGNREVEEPAPPGERKSSYSGRRRYRQQQAVNRLKGKAVRNREEIHTVGGDVYKAGMLWRVSKYSTPTNVMIWGINPDGTDERRKKGKQSARSVSKISPEDLIIDSTIPDPPEKK